MSTALSTLHNPVDNPHLHAGLTVLEHVLAFRLRQFFKVEASQEEGAAQFAPPTGNDAYSRFVREHAPDRDAQLLVLLALMPRVKPDFFERIVQSVSPGAGDYPQLGGIRGRQHRGFLPTGDTALFLLAGDDVGVRLGRRCSAANIRSCAKASSISRTRWKASRP